MKEIQTADELAAALEASNSEPVFLFKHSTTCPISAGAFRRVGDYLDKAGDDAATIYLVKVIESRPVSNQIAADVGVEHQSPQMILVREGRACWDASHGAIGGRAIEGALASASH